MESTKFELVELVALAGILLGCRSTASNATDAVIAGQFDTTDTADFDAAATLDVPTSDTSLDSSSRPLTFVALEPERMPSTWSLEAVAGRRWHVATNGSPGGDGGEGAPLDHIVAALARAEPGDVVLVHAGEYAEWDDDSGHGFSVRTPNVAVAGVAGERVTVVPGPGSFGYGPQLAASGTVLANLSIRGFDTVGVELGGAGPVSDLVLQDVTVDAATEGIVSYEDLGGTAPVVRGLLLSGVTIRGTGLIGFSCNVGPCVDVRFQNVRVEMRDAGSEDSGADAIAFERGDNLWLDGVEVAHAAADGIDLKATRVLVTRSRVHHVRRNGLKLWHGGDVQNTIVDHTGADAGVVFDGPGRYRLLHSVVAHHLEGRPGAYTMTVAYDTTCGQGGMPANYCCRQDTGDSAGTGPLCDTVELAVVNSVFAVGSGPISVPSRVGLTLRNSAFVDFAEEGAVLELRDSGERLSVRGLVSEGIGSALLDELALLDEVDFVPRGDGAFVDAGVIDEPMPPTDIDGWPRVVGRAPDIGPHEVQSPR